MSTERATSDPGTAYTRESATPALTPIGPAPQVADGGYPAAPSAAVCGALAPCRDAATGCPIGVDIPAVTRAIAGGDHEAAFSIVRAAHPFASTCGSGCHAPCESA